MKNESAKYLSGFGNHFSSEARAGALPQDQNSPQKIAKGLFAEQLSGSAFTAPRHTNRKTWVYRLHPSVTHGAHFEKSKTFAGMESELNPKALSPNQMRWGARREPKAKTNFFESWVRSAGNGNPNDQVGCSVYTYCNNQFRDDFFFYSADGEFMFVPENGSLTLRTELGVIEVSPGEIAVIPRGFRFQVLAGVRSKGVSSSFWRGYVLENFGSSFRLPELGPIGANGLANPRHFLTPAAAFEDKKGKFTLGAKIGGQVFTAKINHSPLDVVAWHGNNVPYKYDLALFNTIGTVSFDHPDPSIFTVLTAPSEIPGVANIDFVIFPPRWMVAEHTFRPPYYHRNNMSEFMGLIYGAYDAKADGFVPGGSSLHNCMSGHGPDRETFDKASKADLKPHKIEGTMAFMFESRLVYIPSEAALKSTELDDDYADCWQGL